MWWVKEDEVVCWFMIILGVGFVVVIVILVLVLLIVIFCKGCDFVVWLGFVLC